MASFHRTGLVIAALTVGGINAQWQDSYRLDFSYDPTSEAGPQNWGEVDVSGSEWVQYPMLDLSENRCGREARPSPITLFPTMPCQDNREILTRQIQESDCKQEDLTFDITPHGLRAYFPSDNDASCRPPRILLNGVDGPFVLAFMELHVRAEHVVDGRRYDAELQMVHTGRGGFSDEMAIVSIMVEANGREENADAQSLIGAWQQVASDESADCATALRRNRALNRRLSRQTNLEFDVEWTNLHGASDMDEEFGSHRRDQLVCKPDRFGAGCEPFGPRRKQYPYNLWPSIWYYGYSGSLTTPPCSSLVNWRILDVPMQISRRQFKQLAGLVKASKSSTCAEDTSAGSTGENFRPLQEIQRDQDVEHCTFDEFSFDMYPPSQQ